MNKLKIAIHKCLFLGALCTATMVAERGTAHAALSLSFDPTNTFSGSAPIGSLTAEFTDIAGGVQLVITSQLGVGENLDPGKALYFNFNPSKNSNNLAFALTANTNFNQQATVSTSTNGFKADGDGHYDILFNFTPSTKAFTGGESQTYRITTTTGTIQASDFDYLSVDSSNGTTWNAAAHVQEPDGKSGWVGATPTPIPAAAWLLGSGVLGMIGLRRKKTA